MFKRSSLKKTGFEVSARKSQQNEDIGEVFQKYQRKSNDEIQDRN